ncbi:hypothetical protein [Mucilaginibacter xinganensis]|uniref:Class I SAM-dependent methyltransferase n=1 Tax=Mucilaginibacter xinganensis TaxID=1234841 RepID=A0A223P3S5_9SPHI|nr:hypothetical protein [Mucilaginibacter xinganensis]ASU36789.1 hypothetical protein MuYL_4906 [Mucilaginibacter xinganensis]
MIKRIIRYIIRRNVVIPEYEEKRAIILSYKKKYNPSIFVETGTFLGDTIECLRKDFKFLYSIELSEELASRAQARFSAYENVKIINGSSDVELEHILREVKEPMLFWLDGHYSGEFTYNNEYIKTAKGDLNTPVVSELELIFNSELPHVILIDDARFFNGTDDYPAIRTLKNMLKKSKVKRELSVKRDIIRIVPTSA